MKKSIQYGGGSFLYTVLVIGIVIIVNLIFIKHHLRYDLTEGAYYSLSPQSEKIISSLTQKVKVVAFTSLEGRVIAKDLLEQYQAKNFSYELVDPDTKPALAAKYEIAGYDALVVETEQGRREVITEVTEEKLTNAIIKATKGDKATIYVLQGHNERAIDDDGPQGFLGVTKLLKTSSFDVKPLKLFETGAIPKDANLLIVPGPRLDLLEKEIALLDKKLQGGLPLLLTLDPGDYPNLEHAMAKYGIGFNSDWILDPVSQDIGFDPLVASVTQYGDHPIVENFKAATFFTFARSIALKKDNKNNAEVFAVGSTSLRSWGETDFDSIDKGNPVFDEEEDNPGPLVVAGAVTYNVGPPKEILKIGQKPKKGRIAVVGDSDFAANAFLTLSLNKDLFQNMVGWLLEREDQVTIRPKSRGFNPILFSDSGLNIIFFTVVCAMPAIAAIAGVIVRARRKRE